MLQATCYFPTSVPVANNEFPVTVTGYRYMRMRSVADSMAYATGYLFSVFRYLYMVSGNNYAEMLCIPAYRYSPLTIDPA